MNTTNTPQQPGPAETTPPVQWPSSLHTRFLSFCLISSRCELKQFDFWENIFHWTTTREEVSFWFCVLYHLISVDVLATQLINIIYIINFSLIHAQIVSLNAPLGHFSQYLKTSHYSMGNWIFTAGNQFMKSWIIGKLKTARRGTSFWRWDVRVELRNLKMNFKLMKLHISLCLLYFYSASVKKSLNVSTLICNKDLMWNQTVWSYQCLWRGAGFLFQWNDQSDSLTCNTDLFSSSFSLVSLQLADTSRNLWSRRATVTVTTAVSCSSSELLHLSFLPLSVTFCPNGLGWWGHVTDICHLWRSTEIL